MIVACNLTTGFILIINQNGTATRLKVILNATVEIYWSNLLGLDNLDRVVLKIYIAERIIKISLQ